MFFISALTFFADCFVLSVGFVGSDNHVEVEFDPDTKRFRVCWTDEDGCLHDLDATSCREAARAACLMALPGDRNAKVILALANALRDKIVWALPEWREERETLLLHCSELTDRQELLAESAA